MDFGANFLEEDHPWEPMPLQLVSGLLVLDRIATMSEIQLPYLPIW